MNKTFIIITQTKKHYVFVERKEKPLKCKQLPCVEHMIDACRNGCGRPACKRESYVAPHFSNFSSSDGAQSKKRKSDAPSNSLPMSMPFKSTVNIKSEIPSMLITPCVLYQLPLATMSLMACDQPGDFGSSLYIFLSKSIVTCFSFSSLRFLPSGN